METWKNVRDLLRPWICCWASEPLCFKVSACHQKKKKGKKRKNEKGSKVGIWIQDWRFDIGFLSLNFFWYRSQVLIFICSFSASFISSLACESRVDFLLTVKFQTLETSVILYQVLTLLYILPISTLSFRKSWAFLSILVLDSWYNVY